MDVHSLQTASMYTKKPKEMGSQSVIFGQVYTANLLRQNRICKIVSDTQCKGTDADISFCITSVSDLIQS